MRLKWILRSSFRTVIVGAGAALLTTLPASPAHAENARRYCTAAACAGTASKPWSATIGFGTAALAAGWIARRREIRDT